MLKEVSSVIATVAAIGAVFTGVSVAWERNQQHPEYSQVVYWAKRPG